MIEDNEAQVKRFGSHELPKSHRFELLTVNSAGKRRTHAFTMVPIISAGSVTALMEAVEERAEESFPMMASIIGRTLDDTDGVPADWTVEEYTADVDAADPDDERAWYFEGPDGEEYEADNTTARNKFEAFDAGSSLRRWRRLMDPANSDDAVRLNDMVDIAKWVISLGTDRPTQARPSSTRGSRKTRR